MSIRPQYHCINTFLDSSGHYHDPKWGHLCWFFHRIVFIGGICSRYLRSPQLRHNNGVTYYKSPGTPGSVWTKEETEIVRKKVIELMRYSNWSPDTRAGLFWTDGTLDGSRGISWVEEKWCKVQSSAHIHHS